MVLGAGTHIVCVCRHIGESLRVRKAEEGWLLTVDRRRDRDGARAARIDVAEGVRERLETISPANPNPKKKKISKKGGGVSGHARESVLVEEDIVVRGLARAEDPLVTAQVKVPLYRARHDRVDDGARGTVRIAAAAAAAAESRTAAALLAAFGLRAVACWGVDGGLGEKDVFVVFPDDDECDGWVEVQLRACLCGVRENC